MNPSRLSSSPSPGCRVDQRHHPAATPLDLHMQASGLLQRIFENFLLSQGEDPSIAIELVLAIPREMRLEILADMDQYVKRREHNLR